MDVELTAEGRASRQRMEGEWTAWGGGTDNKRWANGGRTDHKWMALIPNRFMYYSV